MTKDTLLQIATGLQIEYRSSADFGLELGRASSAGGPHTLAILQAFGVPRSIKAALDQITVVSGTHEWIQLTAEIAHLRSEGMLVEVESRLPGARLQKSGRGFGASPVHVAMLEDRFRTSSYLDAIRSSVRPGDVVVDLGTGTGVLAIAAAQAGASRVYAIEASGIAATAREMFEANRVADRITLVEGHSTQIELPERADLLVAEIIGNDPLDEQILEWTADAVRRFLKPNARLLPAAMRVYAAPVQLRRNERGRWAFTKRVTDQWSETYGIDFSRLPEISQGASPMRLMVPPKTAARWRLMAQPVVVASYDLSLTIHPRTDIRLDFELEADGRVDGLLVWFEADLSESIQLSTHPAAFRGDNHWLHPLHLLAAPLRVTRGQRLLFSRQAMADDFTVELT